MVLQGGKQSKVATKTASFSTSAIAIRQLLAAGPYGFCGFCGFYWTFLFHLVRSEEFLGRFFDIHPMGCRT
jgi:hypothetical protein